MKKIIVVLPFCALFTFCSSSKKAAAPATVGISNVNVSRNDTMTSAANASSSFTAADRDWAYSSKHDTSLNGTWVLEGLATADGTWSNTQTTSSDSTASTTASDTAITVTTDTANMAAATNGTRKGKRGRLKDKRKALYDSARVRLNNTDYKSTATLDTTAEAFKYWTRIPSVTLNATKLVFTGTTGCNSMSGSFNFNNKDIQFGRNIVTSKMSCNEYNETNFLSALKKADNYTLSGNMLELKQGATRLLAFKKG